VLVLVVVGATTAAFVVTERLKLERAPITAPRFTKQFSPTCDCLTNTAKLTIRFRTGDTVDAEVVDRQGEAVRTLAADRPVARGDVTFVWNGRDDAGRVVDDGRYRLQLHLEESRRSFLVPTTFRVDTKAPRLRVLRVTRGTISPNGDGVNERVRVVYRAGSKSRPILSANEEVVVRGKARVAGRAQVQWNGRIGGEAAPAGEYALTLQVRDLAGNLSKAVAAGTVLVRYIEIAADAYAAASGGLLRFRVVTDALPFTWALVDERGLVVRSGESDRNAVAVRLPKDLAAGGYRLEVAGRGGTDEAVVTVARRRGL
jgi:flagellar hook assembly protein FlgD